MIEHWGACEKVVGQAKDVIVEYWNDVVCKVEVQDLATQIRYCRVRKTRPKKDKSETVRVQICLDVARDDWARKLEPIVVQLMKQEGGIKKIGAAPRGSLERDAQRLLDLLK